MTERQRLPNRRHALTLDLSFDGHGFTVTTSLVNGRVVEAFISSAKSGTTLEAICHDAAIILSLAFQNNITVTALRHSSKRTDDGRPSSLIGAVLDTLQILEAEFERVRSEIDAARDDGGAK